MPILDINFAVAPLPLGFRGTPDELFEWLVENATFALDAEIPAGQIGGSRPTENIGVFYDEFGVETWRDGEYQPISDVPIGSIIATADLSGAAPANYLFCDGTEKSRATYGKLFAKLGTSWGTPSTPSFFKLPNLSGRVIIGKGTADFSANTFPNNSDARATQVATPATVFGKAPERLQGEYIGTNMPLYVNNSSDGFAWPDMPANSILTPYFRNGVKAPDDVTMNITTRISDTTPTAVVLPMLIRYR